MKAEAAGWTRCFNWRNGVDRGRKLIPNEGWRFPLHPTPWTSGGMNLHQF
jgi:hypothetical protein